ncbi:unnamed protein product [Durusdinium trenchii]|uniref:Uncharacterized protein n=1 Tax=Durusdinium trenchii TaxID=1381693 RepID=A0ABP0J6G2_9DINO
MGQGLSGAKSKIAGVLGGGGTEGDAAASGGRSPTTPVEGQYTVKEALELQKALKAAFAEDAFQKLLKHAQDRHPKRGIRGHADQTAFTTQLQGLLLHVYRRVLPQTPWCLQAGWDGYREMMMRMTAASEDPRVIQGREDINRLLGLPRHTIIQPPAAEPVFVETPDGSGNQGLFGAPMLIDADGDYAHEFWEEDKAGQLVLVTPQVAASFG